MPNARSSAAAVLPPTAPSSRDSRLCPGMPPSLGIVRDVDCGQVSHGVPAYGGGVFRQLLARGYWAFSRFTLHTAPAPDRPSVVLGVPHTSNWDFAIMLAI